MSLGRLFIVATPIGNLDDLSSRALSVLSSVDAILCEDTRVSKKILFNAGIEGKTLVAFHQHSDALVIRRIKDLLAAGQNCAFLTDAGTPGISDPGGLLIEKLLANLGPDFLISPIPGPSAVTAILSVAGLKADRFLFLGFAPHKKGRRNFFKRIIENQETTVFFESPHRIQKTLVELATTAKVGPAPTLARRLVIGRELTKKFETIYRGELTRARTLVPKAEQRGEFVLVVEGRPKT